MGERDGARDGRDAVAHHLTHRVHDAATAQLMALLERELRQEIDSIGGAVARLDSLIGASKERATAVHRSWRQQAEHHQARPELEARHALCGAQFW